MKPRSVAVVLAVLTLGLFAPSVAAVAASGSGHAAAAPAHRLRIRHMKATARVGRPTISPLGRWVLSRGPLPRDAAAAIAGTPPARPRVGGRSMVPDTVSGPKGASALTSWAGAYNKDVTPSDSTNAYGPAGLLEAINTRVAIYPPGATTASGSVGLAKLVGDGNGDGCITDPQAQYDPETQRYYVVALDACTNPRLFFAWSKTDTPTTSTADWCGGNYIQESNTTTLADYPKLGDTQNFLLIGSNHYYDVKPYNYLGAYVDALPKVPASQGTSCSYVSTGATEFGALPASWGTPSDPFQAFTPVPVRQTVAGTTGYVIDSEDYYATGSHIDVFEVMDSTTSILMGNPAPLAAASWSQPTTAPQKGTKDTLDVLDPRLTNAWMALDPAQGGAEQIWTQNTTDGGPGIFGSEVRWYEIDPSTPSLTQSGSAHSTSYWTFNGSIAPDYTLDGSGAFGDSMVLTFNRSNSSSWPAVMAVSKVGAGAQSSWLTVHKSTAPEEDFSCVPYYSGGPPTCRWGDYAGATPDLSASSAGTHGVVYITSMWSSTGNTTDQVDWRTWNAKISPQPPTATMTSPTTIFSRDTSFDVAWAGANGAQAFDVRYRKATSSSNSFGSYATWQTDTATTSATFGGKAGSTYCFSAQGIDGGGLTGPYSSEACTAVPLDDRAFTRSSHWSQKTGTGWYLGTYLQTSTNGAYLTRSNVHTKRINLVVGTCSGCGTVKVYWNGTLKKTISLNSSSMEMEVFKAVVTFSSVQTGTVKVVVSSSGKKVYIDGLAVSQK